MKRFAAALLLLAALRASAAPVPAAPAPTKEAMVQEMDDLKARWLVDPNSPVTLRFAPRLAELRLTASLADGEPALAKVRKDFHDWKDALYRAKWGDARAWGYSGLTYDQYRNGVTGAQAAVASMRAQAAQREVQRRLKQESLAAASAGADPRAFFDLGAPRGTADVPGPRAPLFARAPSAPAVRASALSPDSAAVPPAPAAVSSPGSFSSFIAGIASVPRAWARRASQYASQIGDAIYNYAAGVQKSLLAGLLQAESGFNSVVGSWKGCLGLGQLSDGVARAYGVRDRTDIAQNVRGSAGFLRDLQKRFSGPGDEARLQALFAEGAAEYDRRLAAAPGADAKTRAAFRHAAFRGIYQRIPYGLQNAVAAYNAGPGAVQKYHGWTHLPLPRGGCVNRPAQDDSYCQTMAYVPRVLENSFGAYVNTRARSEAPAVLPL